MYRDNTLIPTETVRLAALGALMESNRRYGELATEIRGLVARIVGPSLDLLGSSLELLRVEGLIRTFDGSAMGEDSLLTLTEDGRSAFRDLVTSRVRAPMNDMSRLVIALKMRFLPLLDVEAQRDQLDMLAEATEIDLVRLRDLRNSAGGGYLTDWLDLDIAQAQDRLAWFRQLEAALQASS